MVQSFRVTEAQLIAFALNLGVGLAEKWLGLASANRAQIATWLKVGRALADLAARLPADYDKLKAMRVDEILGGELASEVALRVQDAKARAAGLTP